MAPTSSAFDIKRELFVVLCIFMVGFDQFGTANKTVFLYQEQQPRTQSHFDVCFRPAADTRQLPGPLMKQRNFWILTLALENCKVIDTIGTRIDDGRIILTILDSWDWSDERAHLMALQEKFNSYFDFVESGLIYEDYPAAEGKDIVVSVIARFDFESSGKKLFEQAAVVGASLNLTLEYQHVPGNPPRSTVTSTVE